MDVREVGRRIRTERERVAMSERDVVAEAGILSQSTLHRIETGLRAQISVQELDALASAIGVPMSRFLDDSPLRERVLAAARVDTEDHDTEAAVSLACDLIELEQRLTAAGVAEPPVAEAPHVRAARRGPRSAG